MHELIVAATQENWPIIKAHIERMETIFEAITREGVEAGEFDVDHAAEAARLFLTNSYAIQHGSLRRSGRTDEPITGSEDRRCPRAEMKKLVGID